MENKILYIAISVGLLVFAFFIISGNFTGRMGSVYRTCTDSDGGKEPMKKGVVYYSSYDREYEYADYCFSKSGKDSERSSLKNMKKYQPVTSKIWLGNFLPAKI